MQRGKLFYLIRNRERGQKEFYESMLRALRDKENEPDGEHMQKLRDMYNQEVSELTADHENQLELLKREKNSMKNSLSEAKEQLNRYKRERNFLDTTYANKVIEYELQIKEIQNKSKQVKYEAKSKIALSNEQLDNERKLHK